MFHVKHSVALSKGLDGQHVSGNHEKTNRIIVTQWQPGIARVLFLIDYPEKINQKALWRGRRPGWWIQRSKEITCRLDR